MIYYNEHDAKKAAWLRENMRAGLIANGDVDERSIKDVRADDVRGYTQCHFFAGIGVWSYALRLAGWPDDREVWTGSCPCQSFSVAGKKLGFADERHLWPDWFRLIAERNPRVVFGEQSSSKDALPWLDLVQSNLEETGYTFGALDICAAGFGAPHIRQRFYFVADTEHAERRPEFEKHGYTSGGDGSRWSGVVSRMGDPCGARPSLCEREAVQRAGRRIEGRATQQPGSSPCGMADAESRGCGERWDAMEPRSCGHHDGTGETYGLDHQRWTGPLNGFWRDADWIFCTDGKWRPVRPGTQPLAHGAPARILRLRGYGDAINAQVAAAFIQAYREARGISR